jgi:hypothetical protein
MDSTPANMMMMAITQAKTGRLIKKLAIDVRLTFGVRRLAFGVSHAATGIIGLLLWNWWRLGTRSQ